MITDEELYNRFSYHEASSEQVNKYSAMRETLLFAARFIINNSPVSREQSLAITHLEEAMFWANAAIARNEN